MNPLIDWISFVIPSPLDGEGKVNYLDPTNGHIVRRQALGKLYQKVGKPVMDTLFGALPLNEEPGRFPYKYVLRDTVSKACVYFDPGINNILIEVSGVGCAQLSEQGEMVRLAAMVSTVCTRIDISVDIDTGFSPIDFVKGGYEKRFRSSAIMQSDNGTSVYVGSMKSPRYAVVYRYNEPHPRAGLLRAEHRFKHEHAKRMCEYIQANGLVMSLAYCGVIYGWSHPLWDPDSIEIEIPKKLDVDPRDSNLARWLLTQVFPAMKRAEREGTIPDLLAFVQTYLFDDDDSESS